MMAVHLYHPHVTFDYSESDVKNASFGSLFLCSMNGDVCNIIVMLFEIYSSAL